MNENYSDRQVSEFRFLPGQILDGRFQIFDQRGRGAFGELYKVKDLFLKEIRAVKLLREDLEGDEEMRLRFLDEVRIAQKLTHKNVCRIYDVRESDGHYYVSMEYLAGENLEQLLRKIGRLSRKRALEIARDLCQGLIAIHSEGILHRDLKPANVMIDENGRAKITDFGLAIAREIVFRSAKTSGTPHYMAPELLSGKGKPTFQSDIYSLGAILYEMFTGQSVHDARSKRGLGPDHPPVPPSEILKSLSPRIQETILKCLEQDCDDRFRNAQAVLMALTGEEIQLEDSKLQYDKLEPQPGHWRPQRDLPLPTQPNWVMKECLRETDLGSVWRADHRETGDHKIYKFALTGHALDSFKEQISAFLSLKQKLGDRDDIRRFEDWNITGKDPHYIEAEYLSEGNLIEWAERQDGGLQQVDLSTRLEIMAQVATTLADAHSVGLVHKNIGPHHVFLTVNETGHVRTHLGGFGLGPEAADIAWFQTYGGAPELDPKNPTHTAKSNIYALGILLYQMVIGNFEGRPVGEWHRSVRDGLLQEIIAEAIDESPTRRFETASDLAKRLRNLEKERQLRKAQKRRKQVIGVTFVGSAFTIFFMILAGIFLNQKNLADHQAERAEREAGSAHQMLDLIVNLNQISDTFSVPADGKKITQHDILSRSADRLIADLDTQPLHQARLMQTIGTVYTRLSYYEDAEELLERALSIQRDNLDARDPELAKTLHALAKVLLSVGKYKEADPLFEEALTIRRLTKDQQEIALILNDQAWSQHSRGHYEEAERLYRRALAIREDLFGDDHIDVAESMSDLAITLTSVGSMEDDSSKMEDAEDLFRNSLKTRQDLLPELDERVAIGEYQLAWNLFYQGKLDESEEFLQEALEAGEISIGEKHHHFGTFKSLEARLKLARGEYEEAETLINEAVKILEESLPEGHWQIASSRGILGECLTGLGRYDEAETLLIESCNTVREATGPHSLYTRDALRRLDDLYKAWGKPKEAERIMQSSPAADP